MNEFRKKTGFENVLEFLRQLELIYLAKILERLDEIEQLSRSEKTREFYTPQEYATRNNLTVRYVQQLIRQGCIAAEKNPVNGRYLISATEVERLESRRKDK